MRILIIVVVVVVVAVVVNFMNFESFCSGYQVYNNNNTISVVRSCNDNGIVISQLIKGFLFFLA